jgi:hypothetical protein
MRFLTGGLGVLKSSPAQRSLARWRSFSFSLILGSAPALCWLLLITGCLLPRQSAAGPVESPEQRPQPQERLTYSVEWRLIRAGTVTIEKRPQQTSVKLESVGIVSTLFRIQDSYNVNFEDAWCATSSLMDSTEGKRHREDKVTFDRNQNHAFFVEKDLVQNKILKQGETSIPHCVSDPMGAFAKLRTMSVPVGQSVQLPVSDGRKSAAVKVTALNKEQIKTPLGTFDAIRYEADLMNGVVYQRKGDVYLWLSEDSRRLPLQIRVKTKFPVGAVTLQLEKEEHP